MKKNTIKLLILSDDDMNCDSTKNDLNEMSLSNAGFSMLVLQNYDMVVYEGKKGTKILKSKYTKTGVVS